MRYDASLNLFSIGIYMFEIQKNLKKLRIKAALVIINTFDNLSPSLWLFRLDNKRATIQRLKSVNSNFTLAVRSPKLW